MKIFAVIPAYNEETTIVQVLQKTKPFVDQILVVNDGSSDQTAQRALVQGVRVITHSVNRGLGASLGTGFAAAQYLGADAVITLDADGQHDPAEIKKFIEAIEHGADVVIGSRMLTGFEGMPWYRQVAQILGNLVTFCLFGAWVTDSQSGFRAFTRFALEKIQIKTNRMEVSSEIIAETKRHKLNLVEVPIKAIYTDYSLSKGQSFFVGLKTLVKLVVRRINQ
ncbi:MAG: Glycosyl transferase family 2 [Candidatus Uhrbacteria bacterium GW2011_GWF2_39_13]|uniref:Glycosyl transferase family 2 n=1 Tax=Candidatus Uhrbacteria bacterium GW2011_GWF2_39_13 TaxID=1618995 RepID=A0A0G0MPT0_9BACT|nr:MAG: Glycosyl transferase family 2 [Candidatus Uhrbacteria bacterium GW2011_GWF2_39_13]HAU66388.1 glycosyltransferase family 2 protein [Candidatus Uhrbacteria bacterium]